MSDDGRAAAPARGWLPAGLIGAWLVVAASASAATSTPSKKTLEELLALGRMRAAAVKVAQAQLGVYETQRSEARRLWAPTGELTYYITGAPRVQCVGPDPRVYQVQPGVDPNDPAIRRANCVNTVTPAGENVNFFSFNLAGVGMQLDARVVQPIYTFGKIENAKSAAEHGVQSGRAGVEAAQRDIDLQIARTYWGLKTLRASLIVVREGRNELEPWVKKIDQDLESAEPKYNETDLLRLKVSLAQVDMLLANLQRGESIAADALQTLAGEEVDIDDSELNPVEVPEQPLAYYLEAAARFRPEVLQIQEGVEASRSVARARRSELLPDIGLAVGLNFRYAPTIEEAQSAFVNHANQFGYGVLLTLRQPLDIAQRLARWSHAKADAQMADARRRLAMDGIRLEISRAYADLTEARRRMRSAEQGQRTAQGWLSAMRQNLDLGTAGPRELIEAARVYFELRLNYIQSIMDVNVNLATLRRTAGLELM